MSAKVPLQNKNEVEFFIKPSASDPQLSSAYPYPYRHNNNQVKKRQGLCDRPYSAALRGEGGMPGSDARDARGRISGRSKNSRRYDWRQDGQPSNIASNKADVRWFPGPIPTAENDWRCCCLPLDFFNCFRAKSQILWCICVAISIRVFFSCSESPQSDFRPSHCNAAMTPVVHSSLSTFSDIGSGQRKTGHGLLTPNPLGPYWRGQAHPHLLLFARPWNCSMNYHNIARGLIPLKAKPSIHCKLSFSV